MLSRHGIIGGLNQTMRGGAVAARRAHNPKVAGSSPAPATLLQTIALKAMVFCLRPKDSGRQKFQIWRFLSTLFLQTHYRSEKPLRGF